MTHYICTGGCQGVAQQPGTCQAEDCPKHEHPLVECNCTDGKHAEVYSNFSMSLRDKVYTITKKIPRGFVATYGQIARLVGTPRGARAIGMFMRTNPDAPLTPCHRVVAADGSLTGYSGRGGIAGKKKMLTIEGVHFKGEKVDLTRSRWNS